MVTFLINLPPQDMQRRLSEALGVYVDAMRYPPGTENQRAAMWLEHTRRRGWQAVAAVEVDAPAGIEPSTEELTVAPLLGVAYGYCGAPDQWWQQQVVQGLRRAGLAQTAIGQWMNSYFELTELHIHPRFQGHGLGEALARRLLAGRGERHVLLRTAHHIVSDGRSESVIVTELAALYTLPLTKKISDQIAKQAHDSNFGSVTLVEKVNQKAVQRNSGKGASKSADVMLRYNFPGGGLTDDALRTLVLLVLDTGAEIRRSLTG